MSKNKEMVNHPEHYGGQEKGCLPSAVFVTAFDAQ